MRKEERKERNDRQDTEKRKRRMEKKRTYEGCKWKTEIMQEKEKKMDTK